MKYRYSVNNNNQLLIKRPKTRAPIPVRGRFSVNKNNQLIYWLNEPVSWQRRYDLPARISFTGNWQLSPNYNLQLNLDETKSQYRVDSLILKGEIVSTGQDTLVFQIIGKDKEGSTHIQLLKLTGSWQADEFNRIVFIIKKKASPDVITLEGSWQINKNQQIDYVYEKTTLKRKARISRALNFEGYWQINNSNRLAYILTHSSKSYFDFRVQIESPNLYPKEGLIKYRIGIGLKKDRPSQVKVFCLYGSWKFSRKAGLTFRMDYGKGRFNDIEFGANIYLNKTDEMAFFLTDKEKQPIGFNITFNHKFLKKRDAQTFLRLKDFFDRKDAAIEAGVRIPF